MEHLKVSNGIDLTLNQILEDQRKGVPAQRSAHVGSLNPHTVGVASLGIRTLLHEHINAGDGGYPTSMIYAGGSTITISQAHEIETLFAEYKRGEWTTEYHPSSAALIRERLMQALGPYTGARIFANSVPAAVTTIQEFGTTVVSLKPEEVISPRLYQLLLRTHTPAQLHYLVCKETPELKDNIVGAAELLLQAPNLTAAILKAYQNAYPAAFEEFITSEGIRLKLTKIDEDNLTYSNSSQSVCVNRDTLALSTMDFLYWQKDALTNTEFNPLKNPKAGPVLSAFAYVTIAALIDLNTDTSWRNREYASIRHIGGNEMHRYMIEDEEAPQRQAELDRLYQIALMALRDKAPQFLEMQIIPGKELNPFVYSGITRELIEKSLEIFSKWQNINLELSNMKKEIKPKLLSELGATSPEELDIKLQKSAIELIKEQDPGLYAQLDKRISEGKSSPQEILERVTKVLVSIETAGGDKIIKDLDQSLNTMLTKHPLSRIVTGKVNGYTLSQYDAFENGVGVPEVIKGIPFSEMNGVINWIRNRGPIS